MARRLAALGASALVAVVTLSGCTGGPAPSPIPTLTALPTPSADPLSLGPVVPTGESAVVVADLAVPWSILRLPDGTTILSERNSARVLEVLPDLSVREVGVVPGVVPDGEGGLLGLEYGADGPWLYTYYTAATDNRVVRFDLEGSAGSYSLGASRDILTGIAKARNHDGGRIKLGPDGALYVTVGDAGQPDLAQNPASLNGKILRINPDGTIPRDNPTAGSAVYSMGHRNPQGIAWDEDGQLWAAEFGQDTWDEFNRIEPGGNYGWPIVEGIGGNPDFIDPVLEWPTDDASPSGLAYVRGTFFLAGLGGKRLWVIQTGGDTVTAEPAFVGTFGRVRDVAAGPDGSVWVITSNTDGRGSPFPSDDKLIQIAVTPLG